MMLPLPIVPPAADNELLGSWIQRTASVYDLSAHHLLDRWQVAPGTSTGASPSVEMRVVAGRAVPSVASQMRAWPQVVAKMIPATGEWLIASDADVAVCPQCLLNDDLAGNPRFRRRGWAQVWQVLCAWHRAPLIAMHDWASRTLEPVPIDRPLRRNATGSIVALGRRAERGVSVRRAMNAVAQLEAAVRGALAGRRPHPGSWGDIEPEAFLSVVLDVTTFVLSRFGPDDPRLPLCVRDLHRFRAGDPLGFFQRQRQRQTNAGEGAADLVSLAHVGDVGWRRCALYWTRELMHARTERSWLPPSLKRDRHERQRALLAGQSAAGIEWLSERARRWPERYQSLRWAGL